MRASDPGRHELPVIFWPLGWGVYSESTSPDFSVILTTVGLTACYVCWIMPYTNADGNLKVQMSV
jgi:hypothetical protein